MTQKQIIMNQLITDVDNLDDTGQIMEIKMILNKLKKLQEIEEDEEKEAEKDENLEGDIRNDEVNANKPEDEEDVPF